MTSYAFVLDANGKQLAPAKEQKAWFLIRKKRAALVSKYPMVIQLKKEIPENEICKDEIRCGIDDGGLHVGIALVQKCKTKNKVVFKGTTIIVITKDIGRQDSTIVNRLKEKNELLQVSYRNDKL